MLIFLCQKAYPGLDGDIFGDDGQRAQDAANGLHLQVHVEGTPAQLIRLDTKLSLAASVLAFTHQIYSYITWCLDISSAMTLSHAAATEPRYPPPCSGELRQK